MARLFVDSQRGLPLTYAAVGATAQTPPADLVVDQTRIRLGEGEAILHSAKSVLQRWEQFQLGWVDIWSPQTLIQVGEIVAVMGYAPGLWWLNASRIVYVVVESGLINQQGFACGTLPGHAECGEERFLIEWDQEDGSVWFDTLAFSRPNHILTRLGDPLVRRTQRQFAREATAARVQSVRRTR